jgi:hypothetical protein
MSDLRIKTEWEDPKRAKGPELRATWGALRIEVAQSDHINVATRFYDMDFDTVRQQVFAPLYPLAEWVAFHWFQMLYGAERISERGHNIRQGAEGFALPSLRFWSEGSSVRVVWSPFVDEGARVEFLSVGEFALPRVTVEQELAGFLNKVIYRLQENGIEKTPLQEEWAAILAMESEERIFCSAAASLGLDPFDLPEGMEEKILRAGSLLSRNVLEEFFLAASSDGVLDEAEAVSSAIQELEKMQRENARLDQMRAAISGVAQTGTAWQTGYDLARRAKGLLAIPAGPTSLSTLKDLTNPQEIGALSRVARVEGLASRNRANGASGVAPDFANRRPESQKFALARVLCEELLLPSAQTSLLTQETTTRQKLNRAFAAELLAPAAELKNRIGRPEISCDQVQDLAEEYKVSSFLIENQIKNHELATITP